MLFPNDKSNSALYLRNNKITQVYCIRIKDLFSSVKSRKGKKPKVVQKNIENKNAGNITTSNKIVSDYTSPYERYILEKSSDSDIAKIEEIMKGKGKRAGKNSPIRSPKTGDVEYKTHDGKVYNVKPILRNKPRTIRFSQDYRTSDNPYNKNFETTEVTHDKYADTKKKKRDHIKRDEINYNNDSGKQSVISLYRKNKHNDGVTCDTCCKCIRKDLLQSKKQPENLKDTKEISQKKKGEKHDCQCNVKTNKVDKRKKYQKDTDSTDKCDAAICGVSAENNEKYKCRCHQKEPINKCAPDCCNINCFDDKNIKSTKLQTTNTKGKDVKLGQGDEINVKSQKDKNGYSTPNINKCLKRCFMRSNNNQVEPANMRNISKHQGEQTGEPFFKVKVNYPDMCLLNADEIKEKIKEIGKSTKICICPSHKTILKKRVCSLGICEKALKNKKTNFTCSCPKDMRIGECTNETCEAHKKNGGVRRSSLEEQKPLFQVTLDQTSMCIMNPKEIETKIIDIENKSCKAGICKKARKKKDKNFVCKCIRDIKPEIGECTDATCRTKVSKDTVSKNLVCRICGTCRSNRDCKMVRGPIDTKMVTNIKSKISCMCARVKRKSENLINYSKQNTRKRHERKSFEISSNRICPQCTQSEINPKSDGVKIKIKKKNLSMFDTKQGDVSKTEVVIQNNKNIDKRENKISSSNDEYICCPPDQKKSKLSCICGSMVGFFNKKSKNMNAEKTHISSSTDKSVQLKLEKRKIKKQEVTREKPLSKQTVKQSSKQTVETSPQRKDGPVCLCDHECQCKIELRKQKRKLKAKKRRLKRQAKETKRKAKIKKRREKRNKKLEKKAHKTALQNLKDLKSGRDSEVQDTNCVAECFVGVFKAAGQLIKGIAFVLFKLITQPKKSYAYIQERLDDPEDTLDRLRNWFDKYWTEKKLKMARSMQGSDTMNVLSDAFQDTALYEAFSVKGKTKKDRILIERQKRERKRRIEKRRQEALYSCRHNLLCTLRKTPCLWVYHICPNFYPQCLSLIAFMKNFFHLILFVCAFVFWTPCIISFECCRAFCCCFLCTQ